MSTVTQRSSPCSISLIFLIDVCANILRINRLHTCRFFPTCSVYAKECIHQFGAAQGLLKTMYRLLRCHPFGGCGFDPVH